MLTQSSISSSIEASFCFVEYKKQDLLLGWIPTAENWQNCSISNRNPPSGQSNIVPVPEKEINKKDLCLVDSLNCSQLSSLAIMLEKSTPTLVYQRRKLPRNSLNASLIQTTECSKPNNSHLSAGSSQTPEAFAKENMVSPGNGEAELVRSPVVVHPLECDNSESFGACSFEEDTGAEENLRNNIPNGFCGANDRCSSSKSNVDLSLALLKIEGDDTAECSSSSALVIGGSGNDISEKAFCISILRSERLLARFQPTRICASAQETSKTNICYLSKSCKVCKLSETSGKMLICDNCEEAFHLSCCNPRIKEIPVDEWLCHSCLKKKHKMLKQKIGNSMNIMNASEGYRCGRADSAGDLGPIQTMLKGAEKYATGVRIGKEYQAEVQGWSGPIVDEVDLISEPVELNPSACENMHESSSRIPSKLSPIGNWLQCQGIIEGVGEDVDGTICGKWRRAPLFEVQTEKWECFCSIFWDPSHADCAVPQELDTDEVLKQLKYIEALKPRLTARKRKLGCSSGSGTQTNGQDSS